MKIISVIVYYSTNKPYKLSLSNTLLLNSSYLFNITLSKIITTSETIFKKYTLINYNWKW